MALPPNAALFATQRKLTGVALSIAPSTDQSLDTEVWSRTSSQSSSLLRVISGLGGNSEMVNIVHQLPLDGRKRWYKFRTVGAGYWPSAFSTEITARPTLLSPSVITTPVSGRGISAPFLFSNASIGSTSSTGLAAVGYGTGVVRASLQKEVAVSALDFEQVNRTAGIGTFDNFGRFTNTQVDSVSYVFQGRVFVPGGCTLYAFGATLLLTNAAATATASLYRLDAGPSRTALKTHTASVSGSFVTYLGLPFSQFVATGAWFLIEVTINNGGVASRSGFGDCAVSYYSPTDATTY